MRHPMCVEYFAGDRIPITAHPSVTREKAWCALADGEALDPSASSDRTLCGQFVVMRIGSGRRKPTCETCNAIIADRKK